MTHNGQIFDFLEKERFISLTTYYQSGKGVATPVDFILEGDKLFIGTKAETHKVKRLKNNNNGSIAPCDMRGKLKGEAINVVARILEGDEEEYAKTKLNEIYSGLFYKVLFSFGKLVFWRKKSEYVYFELVSV